MSTADLALSSSASLLLVLPPAPIERLTLPTSPAPLPRTPFPLAATLAPVGVSLAIWVVTGSPYSLLFAALGPVVALGGLVDGRRQRRRSARREQAAALDALDRTSAKIRMIHQIERERCQTVAAAPSLESAAAALDGGAAATEAPLPLVVGLADLPPIVALTDDGVQPDGTPAVRGAIAQVRREASVFSDAPWLADARAGIGVIAPPPLARAVARSLALQAAIRCSPRESTVRAPADEGWVRALPHVVNVSAERAFVIEQQSMSGASAPLVIAWAETRRELPTGLGCVLDLERLCLDASAPPAGRSGEPRRVRLFALGMVRAEQVAGALAAAAAARGIVATARVLPDRVRLAELVGDPIDPRDDPAAEAGSLRAPVGYGTDGVVELDLVRDGPHAVVAGTTGTGKSEFLVSWVLAMASRYPPAAVTFLLIDFKGGAAFAPLSRVPHVAGIVSDLDAHRSQRAIESLRAELRRRETVFAERGARSIDDLHGELPRLVIVVDEFAAVVSGQPELHEVFADLAARGRSLGLHLILCTQRPAGVIRDGVLANVTLRISLRVLERGDSLAMLGSEAAARLTAEPRGRAVIADGSGSLCELQLAIADRDDADRVRVGSTAATPVWCEPLPELIPLAQLEREAVEEGISLPTTGGEPRRAGPLLGRLDLPTEQRQPLVRHDPRRDGHVLVLGAAASGKTNALALFARSDAPLVLPREPAEAWTVVDALLSSSVSLSRPHDDGGVVPRLLIADDLDVLIDRFDPELRHDFVERLERLARASGTVTIVASAQRLTVSIQRLSGMFGSRLLLRQPTRDEHVLAGGEGTRFDSRLPPGSGTWRGEVIQLALADRPVPPPQLPALPRVTLTGTVPLALVAARPREVLPALSRRGLQIIALGDQPPPSEHELRQIGSAQPLVVLGDPDAWQTEWTLLGLARREWQIAVTGCTASELRAIARTRDVPPPLGERAGECWVIGSGDVRRAVLDL